MSLIPILILDEDDTGSGELMTLEEFYDTINLHIKNVNVDPKEILVRIQSVEYEDYDNGGWINMGEIEFLVKK